MYKINLLIVDDKPANIYAIKTLLKTNQEIKIYEALAVQDALVLIMKERIDLILSDIQMPETNGFEFAKILKKNNKTKDIPFIFMTAAYNNEVYQKEGYSLGAIEYITKPIDETILQLKLSKYIEIFHAYRKIEEQKKYINKLLEASDEAQIIIDSTMTIVDYNEKAKTIFEKLSGNIMIGKLLEEEEEEEEELHYLLEKIDLQKEAISTFRHKKKYYKMHNKRLDDTLFMISFFDITHEVKENKRKDVIYNSQKAIVVVSDGKHIKNINSAFFEEFGFENLEDFKEQHKCICELFVLKEGTHYLMPIMDGLAWNKYMQKHKNEVYEALMIDKNGKEKIYEVKSSGNLFAEEEEEEEEVIIFNDITDLTDKNQMLLMQSRQAAMGEMISMVAHQWRQPLTSISLTLLRMKVKFELESLSLGEFKENISKVQNVVEHLSKTIDLFQDYFKEKDGSKVILARVFEGIENIIKPILEKNSIEYFYEMQDSLMQNCEIDNRLDQVFLNIYQNAIDALKGDNCIEHKRVTTQIYKDEKMLYITICDNAGGISSNILDKIFNPYFSTKSKNGSGLGLYMSKDIVEKHIGGLLRVYNKKEGACFEMQLPFVKVGEHNE